MEINSKTTPSLQKKILIPRGSSLADLGAKKTLDLFRAAAARVPAYKAFLKSERINPARIKTIADFASVPLTDAKNYIAKYSLKDRCWDGDVTATQFIATSSGTTGEPKYWPRNGAQDTEAAGVHEFLYREYFTIQDRSTLVLIGFPMGIYISGVATLLPTWLTALGGKYKMTTMSIGNNKKEMLRAVQNLSGNYDQTILIGHPFFIKDVIESGAAEGIKWAKKNLGLMFCSEGFSEAWRQYIAEKAGMPKSSLRIFNTYGSSEMLLMGYETPFSVAFKRLAEEDSAVLQALGADLVTPQFFQYNPLIRYIESVDGRLVFSSSSGIPLVRFDLHDRAEIFSLEQIKSAASHLKPKYPWPMVALLGRSDDTIKFHGVNIYPEHIKAGLMTKRFMRSSTGKFVIRKFLGRGMDQHWEINIELSQGAVPSKGLAREMQTSITEKLRKINLEYLDMSSHIKKDVRPRVKLWPYQHSRYFKAGLKPRYINHNN